MSDLHRTTAAHNGHGDGGPAHRADTAALEADIARQRAALAETVQDLHDRLDVKARAQHKAHQAQEKAQEKAQEIRQQPQLVAAGAGVVLALVGLVLWRTWKEHR